MLTLLPTGEELCAGHAGRGLARWYWFLLSYTSQLRIIHSGVIIMDSWFCLSTILQGLFNCGNYVKCWTYHIWRMIVIQGNLRCFPCAKNKIFSSKVYFHDISQADLFNGQVLVGSFFFNFAAEFMFDYHANNYFSSCACFARKHSRNTQQNVLTKNRGYQYDWITLHQQ